MSKFELRKIESVRGKQDFFELFKNGKSEFKEFCDNLEHNSQYLLELEDVFVYMSMVANNLHISGTKFHNLSGNKDGFNEFEIKTKHLRVYFFHLKKEGKVIVTSGFKKNQKKDITHFRTLKAEFLEMYKQGRQ